MPKCFSGRGSAPGAPDPSGGAYSAPPDLLAGLKGPTSKGRGGEGKRKGRGGKGRGGEGKREEGKGGEERGRGCCPPPLVKFLDPPLKFTTYSGKVAHKPRKKPLDYGGNPDRTS